TNFINESKKHFANILTSYGRPYKCIFCASRSISGRKVVVRPADDVLEELDYLVKECNIELLNIMDDNILFDKERAKYIFNEIIYRKYDIEIRIDNVAIWHLDEEIIRLLKKAGCTRMGVSIESGCERVLHKIIRKPLKLEIVKPVRELCREVNILLQANFIIGFPGETWNEIRESLKFAEECDFDLTSIHIATPLPKTDLYDYAIETKTLDVNFSFFDDTHFGMGVGYITTDEFTPKELEILRAFEWDRINFSTSEKRERACRILELTQEELKDFRKQTRINCGHYIR
ncbi:MAG: radical SAM protein, partial [Anaeroplasmataceae bacterium]|nr:radical SAM protein [Anaeroplasmataceae bacterium]